MKKKENSEFPLVEIAGNHYEMGYDLGKQISNRICEYLDWIRFKTKETKIESQKRSMSFYALIKDYSIDYIEEITGISEGANIPFEDAMLCQVRFGNLNNNIKHTRENGGGVFHVCWDHKCNFPLPLGFRAFS